MTSASDHHPRQVTYPRVRDYRPGDDETIWRTISSALAPYGLSIDPTGTDADLDDITATYLLPGGRFRILELRGEVSGCYGLKVEEPAVVELRKMYLRPELKGQGLGKLLLQDALAIARRLGARSIVLETNSRLIEALALYRSAGFTPYDRPSVATRCDLAMRLELGGRTSD